MSVTLIGPNYASDWLKGESHAGEFYSRDQITLAAGSGVLVTGTVLGRITASGKYVPVVAGASDGSQTAVAILFDQSVDTTAADQPAIAVARQATVSHAGLVWGSTINSANLRAAAVAQLKAVGIIDRQAA